MEGLSGGITGGITRITKNFGTVVLKKISVRFFMKNCSAFDFFCEIVQCMEGGVTNGYISFHPTPFQPLQFQSFTVSTVHTSNHLPFRPLAISTAENSTYSIRFKVIQILQDVRKQLHQLKNQLNIINKTVLRNFQRSFSMNYHMQRTSPERNQMQFASL